VMVVDLCLALWSLSLDNCAIVEKKYVSITSFFCSL
jgi:hypothetical protein